MSDSAPTPPHELTPSEGAAAQPVVAPPATISEAVAPEAPASETPTPSDGAETAATLTLDAVTCPSCEAVLRNVRVEPGATLRCLNCGKRFKPLLAGGSGEVVSEASRENAPALVREPGSVGYWLLRIPAILLCAGACVGAALIFAFNIRYTRGYHELVFWSYLPLMPWCGAFLLLLSRSLARLDAGGIRVAWRSGALKTALPAVPGSSLPYLAPIAIAGGVLPVICVRAEPDSSEAAIIGGLFGALLFYIGFAMEDLRQFIWRQEVLARACCSDAGIDTEDGATNQISWSGIFLAGIAVFMGAMIVLLSFEQMRWRNSWRQTLVPGYCGVALIAVSYTVYRLSRDWDRAVAWWQLARWAGTMKAAGSDSSRGLKENRWPWRMGIWPPPIARDLSGWHQLTVWVPRLWMGWGALWLTVLLIDDHPNRGTQVFALICVCCALACLALWLSVFLPRVARWRAAQETVWMLNGASGVAGSAFYRFLIWINIAAAAIEFSALSILLINDWTRWSRWRFVEMAAFPLIMVGVHFPIIWLGLLLREFLSAENACATAGNTEDE